MTSVALQTWESDAKVALDEMAAAHVAVGGGARGRRYTTAQINHAYAVLLSSQFQRYCRDLHTESVAYIVSAIAPATLGPIVRSRFVEGRKLDHGNPNPSNLGSDFGRLGLSFWAEVQKRDGRNKKRQEALNHLCTWRNAIAHQDFPPAGLVPPAPLRLGTVKGWRSACSALGKEFDQVLCAHLAALVGHTPW